MLKKKKAVSRRPEPEEEKEETRTSTKGNRKSMASAFDNAKPAGYIKDGKYRAIIIDIKMNKPTANGQSASIRYEIADEGEFQGQELSQLYGIVDAEGEEQKGCGYLKRDLAVLGRGDVRFAELEDAFAEIKEEMPGVNITVKNNPPYTNAYLGSLCEDDEIDEWKQNRPDKPY